MTLQYLSHSGFLVTTSQGVKILIDPFLEGNPSAPMKPQDLKADYIVLTHAHGDHIGDSFKIADKKKTTFICVNELAIYCQSKGYQAHNMHIGGSHEFEFGKVKFTIAHHGSMTPDNQYAGGAAGVLLFIDGKTIYHTGDTGLFYDMKLIGELHKIDYMLLPIGDNFTMGIDDAVYAVELANPQTAIPMHYNTFPVIEADPEEFAAKIASNGKKSRVMKYGEVIEL